jgi:hypothetical protein
MSVESKLGMFFKGQEKNNDKSAFKGSFAVMRYLFDPMVMTMNLKEILVSKKIHDLLLEYMNTYSNITFDHITRIYGIPIVVNSSFGDGIIEFHLSDRIIMENINL